MRIKELFEETVSIKQLVTSPRIDATSSIGYYAVVQGNKLWKTNLLSSSEAQEVIEKYRQTKKDTKNLRIVFITE